MGYMALKKVCCGHTSCQIFADVNLVTTSHFTSAL